MCVGVGRNRWKMYIQRWTNTVIIETWLIYRPWFKWFSALNTLYGCNLLSLLITIKSTKSLFHTGLFLDEPGILNDGSFLNGSVFELLQAFWSELIGFEKVYSQYKRWHITLKNTIKYCKLMNYKINLSDQTQNLPKYYILLLKLSSAVTALPLLENIIKFENNDDHR